MALSSASRYDVWVPIPERMIQSATHYLNTLPVKRSTRTDLFQFVKRLVYRGKVSMVVLASSLVYLERLTTIRKLNAFKINSLELAFLVAILLASKFHEDRALSVFKVVNIARDEWTTSEVSMMEREFLHHLNYNLWLEMEELKKFITTE
ncbi:hypothetical protein K7432_010346 [Basidiobolus ranarum]|uniref:Cyclin N-terminal domain-containing protein n=1 Tax=Basidiobolus ranarum TaxID=34480 RepID=A0ABR2VVK7_9FUNG